MAAYGLGLRTQKVSRCGIEGEKHVHIYIYIYTYIYTLLL